MTFYRSLMTSMIFILSYHISLINKVLSVLTSESMCSTSLIQINYININYFVNIMDLILSYPIYIIYTKVLSSFNIRHQCVHSHRFSPSNTLYNRKHHDLILCLSISFNTGFISCLTSESMCSFTSHSPE